MPGPYAPPPPSHDGVSQTVLVWPHHAATIALWLLMLGGWAIWGWSVLRGAACNWCGRDRGECKHTRGSD